MAKIIINNNKFVLYDFENEAEFEQAVVQHHTYLFGKDTVYIDVKVRIGRDNHRGIPDAFLIDFFDPKKPQLYIVENELASHDVYSHIAEQVVRFGTSAITSANQIRSLLVSAVEDNREIHSKIERFLKQTVFKTVTELMLYLTENDIKTVIAINEITADLNLAFRIFKNPPDIVLLQRYTHANTTAYYFEPMRDEVDDIESVRATSEDTADFDTVVCAAFEDGFKHAYIENDAWWAIRLSQKAREQLRYLAIYEKSPIAHISHYAEVERIEPYKDTGKYILYLKNKKTIKPIKLGTGKKGEAPQAPRYTTLENLLKARTIGELWNSRNQ